MTLDPETEREINRLFLTLLKRLAITVLVMMIASIGVITLAHATHNIAIGVFFLSVLIGLLISFWRRVGQVFIQVHMLGVKRLWQRRYADAAFALELFHKLGNMSFDRDGAMHYYLTLAYLCLNQPEKAAKIAEWLRRHRPRHPYAQFAADAIRIIQSSQEQISAQQIDGLVRKKHQGLVQP